MILISAATKFQPTHPHGVRHAGGAGQGAWLGFNPRTRTGCDEDAIATLQAKSAFQPTHPHGVRLLDKCRRILSRSSTHAPARVRPPRPYSGKTGGRLNPRTARVRPKTINFTLTLRCFNPRTCTGCDANSSATVGVGDGFQLHAPARGATSRCRRRIFLFFLFQPTHPHGVRLCPCTRSILPC